jgi:hypothetical protein
MKYQIRTALGITENHFSNMVDCILGTLQGSGASPCIWLAISAVLIASLEQQSPGAGFSATLVTNYTNGISLGNGSTAPHR